MQAHKLCTLSEAIRAHDEEVASGIDRVIRGSESPPPAASDVLRHKEFGALQMRRGPQEAHSVRVDEVQRLAANPQEIVERVTKNLGDIADVSPRVAGEIANTAYRVVSYLSKVSQTPPKPGPLAKDWSHSESERHAVLERMEIAQWTRRIWTHAARGTLTPGRMEALKECYPRVAQQIQDAAISKLAEAPRAVPYRQRLMLSLLSGVDPDGTLSPKAILANQLAIQASYASQRAVGSRIGGATKLTLAARTATKSERLEARDAEA